jgi:hypothetical protein
MQDNMEEELPLLMVVRYMLVLLPAKATTFFIVLKNFMFDY